VEVSSLYLLVARMYVQYIYAIWNHKFAVVQSYPIRVRFYQIYGKQHQTNVFFFFFLPLSFL
jgi:hypothetical protein